MASRRSTIFSPFPLFVDETPKPNQTWKKATLIPQSRKVNGFGRMFDEASITLSAERNAEFRENIPSTPQNEEEATEPVQLVPFTQLFRFATRFDLFCIIAGTIASIAIGIMIPLEILIFGNLVSDITPSFAKGNLLESILPAIKAIVYVGAANLVAGWLSNMTFVISGANQMMTIRKKYLHSILRQENGWFDTAKGESLNSRLASDTQNIQDAISEKLGIVAQNLAQCVAGIVVAFIRGWKLAAVGVTVVPLTVVIGGVMFSFIAIMSTKSQNAYAKAGSVAEEAFGAIRTVHTFSLQQRFQKRFQEKLEVSLKSHYRSAISLGLGLGSLTLIVFGSYGMVIWYGSKLVRDGEKDMDGGRVLTIFLSLVMSAYALVSMSPHIPAFAKGRASAHYVFTTIDRIPSIDPDRFGGRKLEPDQLSGNISLRNVKFSYPSRPSVPILRDFSIEIPSGKRVAFVGSSGSGKSTIVSLIQRFYDPTGGEVQLDGIDLKDLDVKWLRTQIGLVGQEPVLFNMTIRENLLQGIPSDCSGDENDIIEACKQANCHNFIMKFPDGYDTVVGDRGGMLSGGQKQRIAIARAILKNPKILLLDEATSALDTNSEKIVQNALDRVSEGRTTIIIAHRLSTVKNADVIVVMNKGAVVEMGSHDVLCSRGGFYARLVKKQSIKKKEDEMPSPVQQGRGRARTRAKTVMLPSGDGLLEEVVIQVDVVDQNDQMNVKQSYFKRVFHMMKPDWGILFFALIGAIGVGGMWPVYGFVFSKVVASLTTNPTEAVKTIYLIIFPIIGGVSFVSHIMEYSLLEIVACRLTKRLREMTFAQILRQEVGFFDLDEHSPGSLTAKLALEAEGVAGMITKVWGEIVVLLSALAIAFSISFFFSWRLTLILLVPVPFLLATAAIEERTLEDHEDSTKKASLKSGQTASEAFREIRTVKSLTMESYWERRYMYNFKGPHKLAYRKAFISSIGRGAHQAITMWTHALGFYAGVRLVEARLDDIEDVFVVSMVILLSTAALGKAVLFATEYSKGKRAAMGVFKLLDRTSLIDPEVPGTVPGHMWGEVSIRNIAFAYPAREEVDIFSGEFGFNARADQTVALVGPSGCGKSTVIGLIERWYDPSSGTVSVDGSDIKSYQLKALRKQISLVGQEPILFDLSIEDNIRYGSDKEISMEEIEASAKLANIHDFIVSLPQGYQTRVGAKGSQLSGGQKQRIAIARAMVRKPKILLLDEATSALDSESESIVQQALDKASKGRTTITIAHRLSTIQNADVICVVKDGKVVEMGKHLDLYAKGGIYTELVDQQDLNAISE